MGRPTDYSPEIADRFCDAIAEGASISRACEPEDMPCDRTIYRWLASNDAFCQKYTRAREIRADFRAEEIVAIADCASPEDVQVARLRVDARKWLMGKESAKKYGDKTTLAGDPDAPVVIATIERVIVDPKATD